VRFVPLPGLRNFQPVALVVLQGFAAVSHPDQQQPSWFGFGSGFAFANSTRVRFLSTCILGSHPVLDDPVLHGMGV